MRRLPGWRQAGRPRRVDSRFARLALQSTDLLRIRRDILIGEFRLDREGYGIADIVRRYIHSIFDHIGGCRGRKAHG